MWSMRKVSTNENKAIHSMRYEKIRLWKKLESKQKQERKSKDSLKFKHSNWNSKFGSNIYYDFEVTYGVLLEVIFRHAIYRFEDWEVKSPAL